MNSNVGRNSPQNKTVRARQDRVRGANACLLKRLTSGDSFHAEVKPTSTKKGTIE